MNAKIEELKSAIRFPKKRLVYDIIWEAVTYDIVGNGECGEACEDDIKERIRNGEIKPTNLHHRLELKDINFTEDEVLTLIKSAIPYLKEIYREAGYEKAIALENDINSLLCELGYVGNIFELPKEFSVLRNGSNGYRMHPIEISAANCFHSGTWQVWCEDSLAVMDDFNNRDYKDAESFVREYSEFDVLIKDFIKEAESFKRTLEFVRAERKLAGKEVK